MPHERLLKKLQGYGIEGKILGWIRDFLSDRTQRVAIGRARSGNTRVISGIPQGSILGPILFTLFINDLPSNIRSKCMIFADDTKIYNASENSEILQEDIETLEKWTETWNLYFNTEKCKVLHIGKRNPNKEYKMKMGEQHINISACTDEKDLGVIFDQNIKFDIHVNTVVSKANRVLGLIKRTFTILDKSIVVKLYKSLVRPILEYANVIWYPTKLSQSRALEKVQRRATRMIQSTGIRNKSYKERLQYLNLQSLKARRIRGDLIQTYKIINNVDDVDQTRFFSQATVNKTRKAFSKLSKKYCRTNISLNFFSQRVVNMWNQLGEETTKAKSLNQFKNLVDKDKVFGDIRFEHD